MLANAYLLSHKNSFFSTLKWTEFRKGRRRKRTLISWVSVSIIVRQCHAGLTYYPAEIQPVIFRYLIHGCRWYSISLRMNQSNWPVIANGQWFLVVIQRPQCCYMNCLGHSKLPIKASCAHNHSWIKVTESHLFIVNKYLRKLQLLLTIPKTFCHG